MSNTEIHPFNIEENGGTSFTAKTPGRHHHHHHHHHHHLHSGFGAFPSPDTKDIIPGIPSPNRVPYHYDDASVHIKKTETDSAKAVGPWPALHITVNKVGKEESPLLNSAKTSTQQDPDVRSPAPLRPELQRPGPETTETNGEPEKQEVKVSRVRKLTRQYSFDEDDLPPALAAVVGSSPPPSSTSPVSKIMTSEGQLSSCAKSPKDTRSMFALEPGDLLMDFTEATPMIKTFPADTSNPFFDPFSTPTQFSAEFMDSKLQCYVVQSSPKILSAATPAPVTRSLMETNSAVPNIYLSDKPISLANSAETRRRELDREKLMKRLLMTEL